MRIVAGGAPLDSVDVALRLAGGGRRGDVRLVRRHLVGPWFGERAGLPRRRARRPPGARGVGVTLGDGGSVEVVRRLDGGRREVLRATSPCVVSVEGGVARLRRAGLAATLRAADAPIERLDRCAAARHADAPLVRPYRPRARALAAPRGDTLARLRQLTDAGGTPAHGERVTLDPPAAAARIVGALARVGLRRLKLAPSSPARSWWGQ